MFCDQTITSVKNMTRQLLLLQPVPKMDGFRAFHNVLSLAGISIYAKKDWNTKKWFLFQSFNLFMGIIVIIMTTGFLVDNSSDLPLVIEAASIWTTGLLMFVSLGICFVYRTDLRTFLEEIIFKDSMLDVPIIQEALKNRGGSKFNELKHLVTSTHKNLLHRTTLLMKAYGTVVIVTGSMYIINAIYSMCVTEDKDLRIFAYYTWVPWSLQDMRVYVASFIFHCFYGYLICITYPGFQATVIMLISQIIRQINIITFVVLNIDQLALEVHYQRDENWQSFCTAVLSQSVQHFVKLKSLNSRLKTICRPFYFTLLMIAIMLVCVCSVKIATTKKTSPELIKTYIHELCCIMVVLLFCFLGQQIQNECEKLEVAVLEKWYIYERKHKRHLLIFHMAIAQRMPILIFGTSVTLSLPTFTWFIKTGSSFFTLMMSFLEEEQ